MSFKKPAVLIIITLFSVKFASLQMVFTSLGKSHQWQQGQPPQQQIFYSQQKLPGQLTQGSPTQQFNLPANYQNLPAQQYNLQPNYQNLPTQQFNLPANYQSFPQSLTSLGGLPTGLPFQASTIAAMLQNRGSNTPSAAKNPENLLANGPKCNKCKELARLLKSSAMDSLMKAATICGHKNENINQQIPFAGFQSQAQKPSILDRFISH